MGSKGKVEAKKSKKPVEVEEDEDLELEEEEETEEVDETETDDDEVEEKPKKKTGRGSGLVPREPVAVPREVFKAQSPEVQKLLKQREKAQAAGDKKELRKIRMNLRKAGFRLSKINEDSEG